MREWLSERPRTTILVVLMLAVIQAVKAPPASAEPKFEWIISTTHTGSGKYVYYLTDDAVKLESIANGGIAIAKAPTWRVSCFRDSDKLEFTSDLKHFDFSRLFSLMPKRGDISIVPVVDIGTEKLKGLLCRKFRLPDGQIHWTPAELKTAPAVSEMVARYFGTPSVSFVPVRSLKSIEAQKLVLQQRAKEDQLKKTVPWMSTWSNVELNSLDRVTIELTGWKKVPYKASDFEYPVGFRQTKDLKEVILSGSTRKDLIDLLGTFDEDGVDKGKQSSAPSGTPRKRSR